MQERHKNIMQNGIKKYFLIHTRMERKIAVQRLNEEKLIISIKYVNFDVELVCNENSFNGTEHREFHLCIIEYTSVRKYSK